MLANKPLKIDLDKISLDDWVAFEDLRKSGDRSARAIRDVLIKFLGTSGWTPEEVGQLNRTEMQQVMQQITERMRGPNGQSGSNSTRHSATAGHSQSQRGFVEPRKNGGYRRGKSRRNSA